MIDVTSKWWPAIVIAAVAGLIGGVVYELVLSRLGDSGLLELPSEQNGAAGSNRKYLDAGFLASLVVGAVAAVGFLYFMPPEVRSQVVMIAGKADQSTTRRLYDPFKLIAAALVVGTGGVSFVTSMRAKLLNTVNTAKLTLVTQTLNGQAEEIHGSIRRMSEGTAEAMPHDEIAGRLATLATLANAARPSE